METVPPKSTASTIAKKGIPWQLTLICVFLLLHIAFNLIFLFTVSLPGQYTSGFVRFMFPGFYILSSLFDILCIFLLLIRRDRAIAVAKTYIVLAVTVSFVLTILLIWNLNVIYVVKVTENTGKELVFTVFMGVEEGSPITEEGRMDLKKFPQMKSKKKDDSFKVYLDIVEGKGGKMLHKYSPIDYGPYRNNIFVHGVAIILLIASIIFLNTNAVYNYVYARVLVKAPEV